VGLELRERCFEGGHVMTDVMSQWRSRHGGHVLEEVIHEEGHVTKKVTLMKEVVPMSGRRSWCEGVYVMKEFMLQTLPQSECGVKSSLHVCLCMSRNARRGECTYLHLLLGRTVSRDLTRSSLYGFHKISGICAGFGCNLFLEQGR
jgi:hypothetical protein